ncbi:hypothetical protein QBC33DRAFT_443858 [Phialemonium atrogriseum]|uniref:FAD-binding domain-containing protein n=1 Tax=Phialemonium atrogriseum TaxID=1093897 RepID=A0AAJ0FU63_9PEZI|nr:uncharacterized protein QBC33DRAFT_443858 [Phialemonium atrogriseum]KAK1772815.1 hypothetical protein QBC33DRAFT_443858 [Phialemonium atrogriseum]
MSAPKIAIIGAGPAGCTLARLLHQAPVPVTVTVFEGEASPNYRSQGGTLDLHTATGLAAIKEAGLWDRFLEHARYDGDRMQITDKDMKVYFQHAGSPAPEDNPRGLLGQRPEIDRADLRRILTESLPDGMIRWGRHLKHVEAAATGGGSTLVFADGTSASGFDLVVGADGAWSKVRRALSDQDPVFAGVGGHELSIPADAAARAPELHAAVGGGSLFANVEGKRLTAQQMGDASMCVYALQRQESADWFDAGKCGYDARDVVQTRRALAGEGGPFADWCPTLRDAIRLTGDEVCVPRSLHMLPVGFRWGHRRGLTLIGDAAHLMTPFAGEGVNVAMEDAMKLAKAVVGAAEKRAEDGAGAADALDEAVVRFEEEMWPRAEKVARLADDLTKAWMFTPGVPGSVMASTAAMHVRFRTPGVVHPFATAFVHSYFFFKGLGR